MKEVERGGKERGPENQMRQGVPNGSFFSKAVSCPLVSHLWLFSFLQNIHILAEYMFLGLYLYPWLTPSVHFSCLWSMVQCYSQLWLRTQEGHHLVTRCLFQTPLQGDLATPVVAFGIAAVNVPMLSHPYTHKNTQHFDREHFFFFTV